MAKDKTAFVCSNCGQESAKWIGKCPACGQWNTFKEIKIAADGGSKAAQTASMMHHKGGKSNVPLRFRDITSNDDPRIDMHYSEFNRVLG